MPDHAFSPHQLERPSRQSKSSPSNNMAISKLSIKSLCSRKRQGSSSRQKTAAQARAAAAENNPHQALSTTLTGQVKSDAATAGSTAAGARCAATAAGTWQQQERMHAHWQQSCKHQQRVSSAEQRCAEDLTYQIACPRI